MSVGKRVARLLYGLYLEHISPRLDDGTDDALLGRVILNKIVTELFEEALSPRSLKCGCADVVLIHDYKANKFRCTPFWVRFGRDSVPDLRDVVDGKIDVYINGRLCPSLQMQIEPKTGIGIFGYDHSLVEERHDDEFEVQNLYEGAAWGHDSNDDKLDSFVFRKHHPSCLKERPRRIFRPTQQQWEAVGTSILEQEVNTLEFEITRRMYSPYPHLWKKRVRCNLFVWDDSAKIIGSDIDSTISKSDVRGLLLPRMTRNLLSWQHIGVTRLYQALHDHGYKLVYLTSRGISQANHTRKYLFERGWGNNVLPIGPLFVTPDKTPTIIKREAIHQQPEQSKIKMLLGLRNCFPGNHDVYQSYHYFHRHPEELAQLEQECLMCGDDDDNDDDDDDDPHHNVLRRGGMFVAGFGNKHNDFLAYKMIGIKGGFNFIIDDCGRIYSKTRTFASYEDLHSHLDELFPHFHEEHRCQYPVRKLKHQQSSSSSSTNDLKITWSQQQQLQQHHHHHHHHQLISAAERWIIIIRP